MYIVQLVFCYCSLARFIEPHVDYRKESDEAQNTSWNDNSIHVLLWLRAEHSVPDCFVVDPKRKQFLSWEVRAAFGGRQPTELRIPQGL